MQKPDSNLPPTSQPWGRWVEDTDSRQSGEIEKLQQQYLSLSRGDGDQASLMASMQANISKLLFEMKFLYAALGQAYPPGSAPPIPPAPSAPVTVDIGADWSRTWGSSSFYTGGGSDTNGTYLYQGSNPENKIGMWHFPTAGIIGKNITNVQMFMANINSPYAPSFVAGFGTHGNGTAPAGKPGRANGFDVGWNRGESKWIGIPSWAYAGLANGSILGFTIGGIGGSNPNYAYFQGVGQPAPPVLRVTYTT